MDVCFELVVRALDEDAGVVVKRRSIFWEGQEHVDPKATYHWGPHFELVLAPRVPDHIAARLDPAFRSGKWAFIHIRGDGLDLFARELNGEALDVEWDGRDLESLLRGQLKDGADWAVVFEWQCDRIDELLDVNMASLVDKLRANLSGPSQPKGFLAIHRATTTS